MTAHWHFESDDAMVTCPQCGITKPQEIETSWEEQDPSNTDDLTVHDMASIVCDTCGHHYDTQLVKDYDSVCYW